MVNEIKGPVGGRGTFRTLKVKIRENITERNIPGENGNVLSWSWKVMLIIKHIQSDLAEFSFVGDFSDRSWFRLFSCFLCVSSLHFEYLCFIKPRCLNINSSTLKNMFNFVQWNTFILLLLNYRQLEKITTRFGTSEKQSQFWDARCWT